MRYNQADPPNHTRDRHACGRDERGHDNDDQSDFYGVHAQRIGLLIPQRQDIDPPSQHQQHGDADQNGGPDQL